MASSRAVLIERRARALATVKLTRLPGLVLNSLSDDYFYDMIVRILNPDQRDMFFGVMLKGTIKELWKTSADRYINKENEGRRLFGEDALGLNRPIFPAILLLFSMRNDEGFYTWRGEPIIEAGMPRIKIHHKADFDVLTDDTLNEIVVRVKDWYGALYKMLVI